MHGSAAVSLVIVQDLWRKQLTEWEACSPFTPDFSLRTTGIPPRLRGRTWPFLIGNAMRISPEIFDICVGRARKLRAWQSLQVRVCGVSFVSVGDAHTLIQTRGCLSHSELAVNQGRLLCMHLLRALVATVRRVELFGGKRADALGRPPTIFPHIMLSHHA
jgi:hypothetical protein